MATSEAVKAANRSERGAHINAAKKKSNVVAFTKKRSKRVLPTRSKILKPDQLARVLAAVRAGKHPERDTVLVLLSFACGLRAQEIAGLRWKRNLLESDGTIGSVVHVTNDIGKRTEERKIPIHPQLRQALKRLRSRRPDDIYVVYSLIDQYANSGRGYSLHRGECHPNTLVQYLRRLYRELGYIGATSHSGRRTFITTTARKCNLTGASIRDVQILAGHKDLGTTAAYIEPSDRQHQLINALY